MQDMKIVMKIGSAEGFFKRGRAIAGLADHGKPILAERAIMYDANGFLLCWRLQVQTDLSRCVGTWGWSSAFFGSGSL
jgi:hypothetical protein